MVSYTALPDRHIIYNNYYSTVIVIGLSDIVYNSMDNELKVTVAVQSGQLQPSYFVEVELNSTVSFQGTVY